MRLHFAILLGLGAWFSACGGAASAPSAPAAEAPASPGAAEPASATSAEPAGSAAAAAPPTSIPDPHTVDDCKKIIAEVATTWKGPTGQPTAGEGKSDRLAAMAEFMTHHRPGFRCCFDIWAGKIPEAKLYSQVTFTMSLDPKGKLKKAVVTEEEGKARVASEVESCLVDVADEVTYPPSPSNKDTDYTHRFDFKPKPKRRH